MLRRAFVNLLLAVGLLPRLPAPDKTSTLIYKRTPRCLEVMGNKKDAMLFFYEWEASLNPTYPNDELVDCVWRHALQMFTEAERRGDRCQVFVGLGSHSKEDLARAEQLAISLGGKPWIEEYS